MNFKNHIVKWYRAVLLPVFHIDNNKSFNDVPSGPQASILPEEQNILKEESADVSTSASSNAVEESTGPTVRMPAAQKKGPAVTGDAAEVLARINSDREGRYSDEIEEARKKAEEERRKAEEKARLDSIMNANKVDVDSFIAQGKTAAQEADEMKRAQEIMDRLNREAAEDEAKKVAEIEEAKRQAAEKEKLAAVNNDANAGGGADDAEKRAQEIFERLQREAAEDEAKKQAELDAAMAEAAQKFGG
jgi:hypothetical protein